MIYTNYDVKLKHSEAAEILDNPDISKLSNIPPFQSMGGGVYLITDVQRIHNKDDWRADGYTWRNYGKNKVRLLRNKNRKEESDKFQRVMLRYHGNDYYHMTLVKYLGVENEYKGSSRGNRKNGFRPHKRTLPSVFNNIKNGGDENPKSVKGRLGSAKSLTVQLTGICCVRNVKQVENA